MKKAWILAAMLALLVTPAWTQARERTTRQGGEHRSAESRHPGAKGQATHKRSSRKKSSRKIKSDSHHQKRSRDNKSASRGHRRNDDRQRDSYRRPSKKDSRHRTSRAPRGKNDRAHRGYGRSHRKDQRHSYRRAAKHHYRHRTFRRAPRYRCVRRSIRVYPSYLPRYEFGYYWSAGYYYPRYHYDYVSYPERAALRVQAEPKDAEVYVDGYYAGIVDDFDGIFQRLYVAPGTHEITLRLEGFQTWSAEVYATPYSTLRVHHHMMPGPAGEVYSGTTSMEPAPGAYE